MTELQEKEFEILRIFVDICNRLHLTYYLVCGSALGAVKYQGFIPWDDDIDVALPRKDYEIFLKEAPGYLPEWCFLQNYRTDPQFPLLGSKLRDSRTTYVEAMCGKLKMNHGVFIDVFPLDGMWRSSEKEKKYRRLRRKVDARRRVFLDYHRYCKACILEFRTNWCYLMNRLFGAYGHPHKAIEEFDRFAASFSTEEADNWCNHANSASENEFASKEQYGQGVIATFEGLPVRVPEQYDAYLTQKYGDWRADIQKEEKQGHHYYEMMDLHQSYVNYFK